MSRLIRNAQPTWKPELPERIPKAMPRKMYPIKTGNVSGNAARNAFYFMNIEPFCRFCLLYQIGKTSAIVQKELIIQTNITIMSIKIKVKQKKSKNMIDKRRRLC